MTYALPGVDGRPGVWTLSGRGFYATSIVGSSPTDFVEQLTRAAKALQAHGLEKLRVIPTTSIEVNRGGNYADLPPGGESVLSCFYDAQGSPTLRYNRSAFIHGFGTHDRTVSEERLDGVLNRLVSLALITRSGPHDDPLYKINEGALPFTLNQEFFIDARKMRGPPEIFYGVAPKIID